MSKETTTEKLLGAASEARNQMNLLDVKLNEYNLQKSKTENKSEVLASKIDDLIGDQESSIKARYIILKDNWNAVDPNNKTDIKDIDNLHKRIVYFIEKLIILRKQLNQLYIDYSDYTIKYKALGFNKSDCLNELESKSIRLKDYNVDGIKNQANKFDLELDYSEYNTIYNSIEEFLKDALTILSHDSEDNEDPKETQELFSSIEALFRELSNAISELQTEYHKKKESLLDSVKQEATEIYHNIIKVIDDSEKLAQADDLFVRLNVINDYEEYYSYSDKEIYDNYLEIKSRLETLTEE